MKYKNFKWNTSKDIAITPIGKFILGESLIMTSEGPIAQGFSLGHPNGTVEKINATKDQAITMVENFYNNLIAVASIPAEEKVEDEEAEKAPVEKDKKSPSRAFPKKTVKLKA